MTTNTYLHVLPYIGYISTHENLRILNIRRFQISDTQPRVILLCIVKLRFAVLIFGHVVSIRKF